MSGFTAHQPQHNDKQPVRKQPWALYYIMILNTLGVMEVKLLKVSRDMPGNMFTLDTKYFSKVVRFMCPNDLVDIIKTWPKTNMAYSYSVANFVVMGSS